MNMRLCGFALALAGLLAFSRPIPALAATETVQISSPNGTMVTDIFMPPGQGPFPVVIFSHGRSGDARERASMTHPMRDSIAAYWTHKGFAVVAPIRPGYGLSGGFDAEESGGSHCTRIPDYNKTATGAATGMVAAVDWVRQQPWAQPNKILLQGQSVGGLGTVAAAARNPPGVVGYINFAGGTGGFPKEWPGKSCQPEILTSLYQQFGGSTHLPGIWFYASNDEYWGPDAPKAWGKAFDGAGGHAILVFTGPVPNGQGHSLLNTAPQLWQAQLNAFVKARGF